MRSWSISVGRLFDVDVRIHLTFLILPMFIYWTDYAAHQGAVNGRRDHGPGWHYPACVAAHELGHMLAAATLWLGPKAVILLPLTGVALYDESRSKRPNAALAWTREIRLAIVGPLDEPCLRRSGRCHHHRHGARHRFVELAVAVRPQPAPQPGVGEPLYRDAEPDARLSARRRPHPTGLHLAHDRSRSATRRAVSISTAIAMVLILAGLFSDSWLTMVGVIMFSAAQLEERALVFQSVLDNVRLEEVMLTDFATLSPADTLEDALDKAVHSLQDDFPVVRGSDMVGVISQAAHPGRAARGREWLRTGRDEQDFRRLAAQ